MPGTQRNSRTHTRRYDGLWFSTALAVALTVFGLVGASLKIEDLLRLSCKVEAISVVKFVLLCTTFVWLAYVLLSTGPSYQVFNYLQRVPRLVFLLVTLVFASLWIGMVVWTSAECSSTCASCPQMAKDSDIGTRFLWGVAGSVCTCTTPNGQQSPGDTGPGVSALEWRSEMSPPDALSQLYNMLHQYGIAVVLIVCLFSAIYLSHTEWPTASQNPQSIQLDDLPGDDAERGVRG